MKWLKSYPVTDVMIKEAMPEHYQPLQDAIKDMDTCYYREDMPGFLEGMEKFKCLYLQAVKRIGKGL
ncbi:MAG: hypothetical protein HZA16_02810 [Nitrospirae bacterium]|nr:hypothetical protein [Nitrospirota bacterium]